MVSPPFLRLGTGPSGATLERRMPRERPPNQSAHTAIMGSRRLEPVVEVQGVDHALHTAEMAAVPSALLKGQPIADLSGADYEIRGALDMVFSGF